MKKKKKATKWIIFARVLLVLQLIASAMIFAMAVKTKMLPAKYIMFAAGGLLIMEFLVFALVHLGQNIMKPKASGYFKRGLGTFISILVIICSLYGTSVLSKVMGTLNDMTGNKNVMEDKIVVYVMKDDPAETIDDAKDYTFAYTDSYGYEETKETIDDINKKTDSTINTKPYASAIEMVDALYSGEVKAMILNTSYVSVITDTEGYEDFETKTKVLYAYTKTYEVEKTEKDVQVTKEPFVVYISGSDTRSKKLAKSRSDVNILAFVNPESRQVLLLNTPRDYYAQINFTGFETLIDQIGGVTVNSEQAFSSSMDSYKFSKGPNELNGEEALAYARERHNLPDGDNGRGRHQMDLISAVIDMMTNSTALLTNYSGILDSLEGMISMDFKSSDISSLINMQLSEGGSWNIKSFAVTGQGTKKTTYSMPIQKVYVTIPDESSVEHAKQLIQKVMNGETITDDDLK